MCLSSHASPSVSHALDVQFYIHDRQSTNSSCSQIGFIFSVFLWCETSKGERRKKGKTETWNDWPANQMNLARHKKILSNNWFMFFFGQRIRRGRWPMLSHIWGIFSFSSSSWDWASSLGFGPQGWDLGFQARILALRLGYGPWGWDLGLKARIQV